MRILDKPTAAGRMVNACMPPVSSRVASCKRCSHRKIRHPASVDCGTDEADKSRCCPTPTSGHETAPESKTKPHHFMIRFELLILGAPKDMFNLLLQRLRLAISLSLKCA